MSDKEVSPVIGFVGAEKTDPDTTPVEAAPVAEETLLEWNIPAEPVAEPVVEGVTEAVADPAPAETLDEAVITPEAVKPTKRVAKK